jgi:hypothetical protein
MSQHFIQVDPLDSPHPIPWNWVLATLSASHSSHLTGTYCYRTQSLISPNRTYAAYSRIQMQVERDYFGSHVTSVLFLENLESGDLQAITPTSPLANNPFLNTGNDLRGHISIVIPVSWSEAGDQLLAREFESILGSDIASDYGVIVDRSRSRVHTIAPTRIRYTNAVLLGWSQLYPERVLFRAGMMGDEHWQQWTVDSMGHTLLARGDRPSIFGQAMNSIWMGPQMQDQKQA